MAGCPTCRGELRWFPRHGWGCDHCRVVYPVAVRAWRRWFIGVVVVAVMVTGSVIARVRSSDEVPDDPPVARLPAPQTASAANIAKYRADLKPLETRLREIARERDVPLKRPTLSILPPNQDDMFSTLVLDDRELVDLGSSRPSWTDDYWNHQAERSALELVVRGTRWGRSPDQLTETSLEHDSHVLRRIAYVVVVRLLTHTRPQAGNGTFYPGALLAEVRVFSIYPKAYLGGAVIEAHSSERINVSRDTDPKSHVESDFAKNVRAAMLRVLNQPAAEKKPVADALLVDDV